MLRMFNGRRDVNAIRGSTSSHVSLPRSFDRMRSNGMLHDDERCPVERAAGVVWAGAKSSAGRSRIRL